MGGRRSRPLLLLLLLLAPRAHAAPQRRPPPPAFDADCSRMLSREAAAIIAADVLPAARRLGVELALACALAPDHARFFAQERAKATVRGGAAWSCRLCGKEFRNEWFIDWHMHRRHAANDSVLGAPRPMRDPAPGAAGAEAGDGAAVHSSSAAPCLADFCGVLGCPSLLFSAHHDDEVDEAARGVAPPDRRDAGGRVGRDSEAIRAAEGGDAVRQPELAHGELESGDEVADEPSAPASSAAAVTLPDETPTIVPLRHNAARPQPGGLPAVPPPSGAVHSHADGRQHDSRLGTRGRERERERCVAVFDSCFPPPTSEGEGAAEVAAAAAAAAEADGAATGQDRKLRRQVPGPSLAERTQRVREELAGAFCASEPHEKRSRHLERERRSAIVAARWTAGLVLLAVTFVAACVWLAFSFLDSTTDVQLRRRRGGVVVEPMAEGGGGGSASGVDSSGAAALRKRAA